MRWGKPTKNKNRRDPRYFLNEQNGHRRAAAGEIGGALEKIDRAIENLMSEMDTGIEGGATPTDEPYTQTIEALHAAREQLSQAYTNLNDQGPPPLHMTRKRSAMDVPHPDR